MADHRLIHPAINNGQLLHLSELAYKQKLHNCFFLSIELLMSIFFVFWTVDQSPLAVPGLVSSRVSPGHVERLWWPHCDEGLLVLWETLSLQSYTSSEKHTHGLTVLWLMAVIESEEGRNVAILSNKNELHCGCRCLFGNCYGTVGNGEFLPRAFANQLQDEIQGMRVFMGNPPVAHLPP